MSFPNILLEILLAHESPKACSRWSGEFAHLCTWLYTDVKHLNPAFYGFPLIVLMLLKPLCGCLQKLEVKWKDSKSGTEQIMCLK